MRQHRQIREDRRPLQRLGEKDVRGKDAAYSAVNGGPVPFSAWASGGRVSLCSTHPTMQARLRLFFERSQPEPQSSHPAKAKGLCQSGLEHFQPCGGREGRKYRVLIENTK
jgi:hypothetical protein